MVHLHAQGYSTFSIVLLTQDVVLSQTAAEAEAKQADIRAKHLKAQLADQQKALASNQKEAGQLQRELDKQVSKVQTCQQR